MRIHRIVHSRGLSLALVLVAMLILAVVLGSLILRTQTNRQFVAHGTERVQARYDLMGDLNEVLERIRQGATPEEAARQVSARSGREILVAGNRLLAASESATVQARLQARAWGHVLFADTLDLNGVRGAFAPDDPHGPARGTPPAPASRFAGFYRDLARQDGVYLAAAPGDCVFQPGGGAWRLENWQGSPSFLYLGGGLGEGLGWTAGIHRWALAGDTWTCTTGEQLSLASGVWTLRTPKQGQALLAGTLFADGTSLSLRSNLRLQGQIVVWGGYLEVNGAELQVEVAARPDTLAVAVLRGEAATPPEDWARAPRPLPGDLLLATGASRLAVGDLDRPEETGALVLAESRLVKRGTRLRVARVVAAAHADLDGVPAGDLVWSGRVGRQPPELLQGTDLSLGLPTSVEMR